jgi:tetratricopeptide (TPR) repeat protein
MATVLLQAGKKEEAMDEYTRSLYINPVSYEAYAALGSIFLPDPERYGKAGIELFNQCVYFFPRNKDIWNNLGFLYTKVDRNEDALKAYKKAIEIDPDFELARKNIQVTLQRLGRTDRTIEETDTLYRTIEQNIVAKNWPRVLAQCQRLVTLVPQSFKAQLYLANSYFSVGRPAQAVPAYEEALKIEPSNTSALGNLALAYLEIKQYERARERFQQLLQIDPQNQIAKEKLEQLKTLLPVSR